MAKKEEKSKPDSPKEITAEDLSGAFDAQNKEHTMAIAHAVIKILREHSDKGFEGIRSEARGMVETNYKGVSQVIKGLKKDISDLRDDTKNTDESMDEEFNTVYDKLEELESTVETAMHNAVEMSGQNANPKYSELEGKITDAVRVAEKALGKITDGLKGRIDKSDKSLGSLADELKLLRKDNKLNYKGSKKTTKSVEDLEAEFKKLSKSIYEFGSAITILGNGTLVGTGFAVNFKNGTNTTVSVTVNATGGIDVAVSASGSFVGSQEKSTSTPDGVRTVFAFAHTPKIIYWNGVFQTLNDDYTVSGNNITFLTGTPLTGDKIVNVYA